MTGKHERLASRVPGVPGNGLIDRRALLGRGILLVGAAAAGTGGSPTGAAAEPVPVDPWPSIRAAEINVETATIGDLQALLPESLITQYFKSSPHPRMVSLIRLALGFYDIEKFLSKNSSVKRVSAPT